MLQPPVPAPQLLNAAGGRLDAEDGLFQRRLGHAVQSLGVLGVDPQAGGLAPRERRRRQGLGGGHFVAAGKDAVRIDPAVVAGREHIALRKKRVVRSSSAICVCHSTRQSRVSGSITAIRPLPPT